MLETPTRDALATRAVRDRRRRGVVLVRVEVPKVPLVRALRARGIVSDDPNIIRAEGGVLLRDIVNTALPS